MFTLLNYTNIVIMEYISSLGTNKTSQSGITPVRKMAYPDHTHEHEVLEKAASLMKLLAEPMRLRILLHLREKECCVKELVDQTGAGQANISKHLSLLNMNGVVSRRKEGLFAYYYVSDPSVYTIFDCVTSVVNNRK